MSGSIAGLLGALDQQQQNQIQQPAVQGLLGNATQQLLPTDPFAAQRAAAAAQAAQPQAPTQPQTAWGAVNDWATAQNKNTPWDPANAATNAGALASGQWPSFADPRMLQDRLAQMAQGTVKVPGVSQQDAQDELDKQLRAANFNYYGGRGGGGEGGTGGGAGGPSQGGPDVSSGPGTW